MLFISGKQLVALLNERVLVGKCLGVAGVGIQIENRLLDSKIDGAELFTLTAAAWALVHVHHKDICPHIWR